MRYVWAVLALGILTGSLMLQSPDSKAQALDTDEGLLVRVEREAVTWWDWVKDATAGVMRYFLPPSPEQVTRRLTSEQAEFWSLLSDAGFELETVEASGGLFGSVQATFRAARELTEADRAWVEERLDAFVAQRSGALAGLQRSIIDMLMQSGQSGTLRVERLHLRMGLFPSVRFSLAPARVADRPGGADDPTDVASLVTP